MAKSPLSQQVLFIFVLKIKTLEIFIPAATELDALMPAFQAALQGKRKIALYGVMGAGKTTLVRAFCRFLGVKDETSSPTFSLINEYHYQDLAGRDALVHHLDLYRLQSPEEAFDIGLEEVLYDPWYCFIEWPERAESLLPEDVVKIQIEIESPTARKLLILQH